MSATGAQVPVKMEEGTDLLELGLPPRVLSNTGLLEEQCVLMLAISQGGGVTVSL